MITAHLPAGYLTGRAIAPSGPVIWAAVLGGVGPDIDLLWFYLIDNRTLHHHHYWVHIPAFWAGIAVIGLPLLRILLPGWIRPALAFLAAIFVHLCLDTIAGDIKWFWPWSNRFVHLVDIPARQSHWVLNFVLHPIFLLEILIWGIALRVMMRPATRQKREM